MVEIRRILGNQTVILTDERQILLPGIEIISDLLITPDSSYDLTLDAISKDRYGRSSGRLQSSDGTDLAVKLLQMGQARLHPRKGESPLSEEMKNAERQAREAGIGLWGTEPYRERDLNHENRLARYLGTYQVFRGQIQDVTLQGKRVALELNGGLQARMEFDPSPVDIQSWKGRTICLRGWLGSLRGLVVTMDRPDQIELLP